MSSNISSRRKFLSGIFRASVVAVIGVAKFPVALAKNFPSKLIEIQGTVLTRSNELYEAWRSSMVWYLFKPNRYPDLIVRVKNIDDVIKAIGHARENNLKVSVRSTGHHITRTCLRSGGVLIDLSELNSIEVDMESKTAWVGPGVRSSEFAGHLKEYGMMFPTAHTAVVGLGGFLLGGGMGWNLQQLGVSCHSIIAAEVVTADGKVVIADEDNHTDLLWAIRGAGATFFGFVTRFKVKIYPLQKSIVKNVYMFKEDKIDFATDLLDKLVPGKDARVEVLTVLKHGEDLPPVTEKGVFFVVTLIAFLENDDEASQTLNHFENSDLSKNTIFKKERIRTTIFDLYEAQGITDATSMFRTTCENMWTDTPSKAIKKLSKHFVNTVSKKSFVLAVYGIKGFTGNQTSLPYFADNYVVCTLTAEKEVELSMNDAWMDKAVALMKPMAKGRYINEIDARRYPEHVLDCFTEDGWKKLLDLRAKYDPYNVFFDFQKIK